MARDKVDSRWLSALGVLSAGLLLCEVNIYSGRHHHRWDVSAEARYTLSEASKRLLAGMDETVTIVLVEGTDAELSVELRQTLASYQSVSPLVRVNTLDPDRSPTEFLALMKELEAGTDALTPDFASDAAFFVQSESRTWLVRRGRLVTSDEQGTPRSNIEAAITEAIARTLHAPKQKVCFITGHGERSIDDESEEGLAELRRLLARNNFEVERSPMDIVDPATSLEGCEGLVLVAPNRPLPAEHVDVLTRAARSASALLLFIDPIVDSEAKVVSANLEGLSSLLGGTPRSAFVLEQDAGAHLPGTMGEVFFAKTKVHPTTQGLSTDSARTDASVLVSAVSPIELTVNSTAAIVLSSSQTVELMTELSERGNAEKISEPVALAIASSVERPDGERRRHLLMGTSSTLVNSAFRDPIKHGNRIFSENVFSWALSRKSMVSVPTRPVMSAGMAISEESLAELLRYVLIYLPLFALGLGTTVLLRRRFVEQRFRAKQGGSDA